MTNRGLRIRVPASIAAADRPGEYRRPRIDIGTVKAARQIAEAPTWTLTGTGWKESPRPEHRIPRLSGALSRGALIPAPRDAARSTRCCAYARRGPNRPFKGLDNFA
jgi:hypothetical protein